ncbi:hypothetical protein H310_12776 [Aphanomyces invadans]|uniref:Uncharacterized protein n=1 Tax=Aphanomyces invadans TaxID=157072 RepID=A0A024TGN2_9STRA|nr:hypothetical protein H310_12776 [Aphanomyces invadans]ETV93169.1 hypothetical protein H310_12776 [Aphanomyces invadans]|eukprot:XP_008878191.1 hypothetical protein H310_12776 [Aphanomyces invadans]
MATPGRSLSACKSSDAIAMSSPNEGMPVLGLSASRSCVKILSSPQSQARLATPAEVATTEQVLQPEGELARDFFVDCGTHTFPYGESYQMDPNLPGEAEVAAQREICDNVENWTEALMDTVDELLEWKDQMMALHALPTNAVAGLVLLSSRFCRCKGRLQVELDRMVDMTHSLIGNLLLNSHIKQYKTNMIDMSVAMDNEKMVLAEEQCKLRAALAQLAHVKAAHRLFRWSRLSCRLREKELSHELDRQASVFHSKREEFHQVVKGQREQITALTESLAKLQAAHAATTAPKTKIVLMPATAATQTKAARLKSAPIRSVGFERPTPVTPSSVPDTKWESAKSPNDPPTKTKRQAQPSTNQETKLDTGVAVVKPPARPRTSGPTPRVRRQHDKQQDIPATALEWRSPQDMAPDERHTYYKETWQERRDKQRDEATTKHMGHLKLDVHASSANVPESSESVPETTVVLPLELSEGASVVALAQGNNALINSLGIRKEKPKR